MTDPVALCAERLAAGDPDRLAAIMPAPKANRAALFGLYATNLELARAPWASAEPLVAEMRLQWWIDALGRLAETGQPVRHDIGPALDLLPGPALAALIEAAQARRADCWSDPFEDTAQLWDYLDATSGAVMAAAGQILAAEGAEARLRSHGAAAGLANWLVAWPELAARGRLGLAGADPGGLGRLAAEGLARIEASTAALRDAPASARLAALPGWQARGILARAATQPERIAQGRLRGTEFSRRLGLLRATVLL